jgi:hypothetical protein
VSVKILRAVVFSDVAFKQPRNSARGNQCKKGGAV